MSVQFILDSQKEYMSLKKLLQMQFTAGHIVLANDNTFAMV